MLGTQDLALFVVAGLLLNVFRAQAVVELAQIAVAAEHRRQGIAEALIRRSLEEVEKELTARSATLKAVFVSTRSDNGAQKLYRKRRRGGSDHFLALLRR